jgi:hypothetical protein
VSFWCRLGWLGQGKIPFMRSKRWWRENWPRDATPDPRFEDFHRRVAELWIDDRAEGYLYMLVHQVATFTGPPWRRSLKHDGWYPEVHFAFRPAPDQPIGAYDFDSWYATSDANIDKLYDEVILRGSVEWEDSSFQVRWLSRGPEADGIIDRHFWEEQDITE